MSTSALRMLLRAKYAMPEWVLMEEVRDAAGFESRRSADAIAMNTWPSRGLEIYGFEIKASRGDWLKELKSPEKAEAIAQYCDRWYIVAVPGIVKIEELPCTWGLLEATTTMRALITKREAPRNKNVRQLNRTFVAAMMRRVGEIDELKLKAKIAQENAEFKAQTERHYQQLNEEQSAKLAEVSRRLKVVEDATGLNLLGGLHGRNPDWHSEERVIKAIKFALAEHDLTERYAGLTSLRGTMQMLMKRIDEMLPEKTA